MVKRATAAALALAPLILCGSGTYTFYAVDSVGNETVETVSVTVETRPPTQPGGESGFWRSVKWFF